MKALYTCAVQSTVVWYLYYGLLCACSSLFAKVLTVHLLLIVTKGWWLLLLWLLGGCAGSIVMCVRSVSSGSVWLRKPPAKIITTSNRQIVQTGEIQREI